MYRGNVNIGVGEDSIVLKTLTIKPREVITLPVVANTSYNFINYFYVIIQTNGDVVLRKLSTTLDAETVTIQCSGIFLA